MHKLLQLPPAFPTTLASTVQIRPSLQLRKPNGVMQSWEQDPLSSICTSEAVVGGQVIDMEMMANQMGPDMLLADNSHPNRSFILQVPPMHSL